MDAPNATYTVGGRVTGLVSDGLVLAINAGDALAIAADGPFTFSQQIATHAPFHITVMTQPVGETCDVTGGDGVVMDADVTTVVVSCHGTTVSLTADRDANACVIRNDGTVWCWGPNVGTGDVYERERIGSDADWASLSGTSCGVKTDNSLWCGIRGDTPMLSDSSAWLEYAEGGCGIRAPGTLWCGYLPDHFTQVGVDATWKHVASYESQACAIRGDGTLWCEGDNSSGQLGAGDASPHTGFVQVVGGSTWKVVALGPNRQICGIQSDDTLWCWGYDGLGLVTDTYGRDPITAPVQRSSGSWASVSIGLTYACAVATDGTGWCWGTNSNGAFGVGDSDAHVGLVEVSGGHLWRNIAATWDTSCGLARDSTVWCWGDSELFGDGNGPNHPRYVPGIVP